MPDKISVTQVASGPDLPGDMVRSKALEGIPPVADQMIGNSSSAFF